MRPLTCARTGQRPISLENWSEVGRAKDVAERFVDGFSHPVGPGLAQAAGHDHTSPGPHRRTMWRCPGRSQEVTEPISARAVIKKIPVL